MTSETCFITIRIPIDNLENRDSNCPNYGEVTNNYYLFDITLL